MAGGPDRRKFVPVSLPTLRIEAVPAAATFPLRHRVLRPHLVVADLSLPGDDDPRVVHLAVREPGGDVVATVRLQPVPCPWRPDVGGSWQLRAMATAEHLRGLGVGAMLVGEAQRHVMEHGGRLVWCNARVRARSFYERAGFAVVSDSWDEPVIGAHVGMVWEVAP